MTTTHQVGHVLRHNGVEEETWNQKHFNKDLLAEMVKAFPLGSLALDQRGFILTVGNYGPLLLGPAEHDGDVYRRRNESGQLVHGCASAMRTLGMPQVEILSHAEVLRRALQRADYLKIERIHDGALFEVAMLAPWPMKGQPRTCAVYIDDHGDLAALNPETSLAKGNPQKRYKKVGFAPELRQRLEQLYAT